VSSGTSLVRRFLRRLWAQRELGASASQDRTAPGCWEWARKMFVGLAALALQRRPVRVASSRISDALPISVLTFFQLFYYSPQPSQPKIVRAASHGLCAFIASISYV
jgi:hypothetical protein